MRVHSIYRSAPVACAIALGLAALLIAGCGGSAPATGVPQSSPAAGGGGAGTVTIVGVDNTFEQTAPTAAAGAITIIFDNRDDGVPHNVHFHKGAKVSGSSVATTDLESGPVEQTLQLDLAAGEYYYQCDAHPATMQGILTVQ